MPELGVGLVGGLHSLRNIRVLAATRRWRRDHLRFPHDRIDSSVVVFDNLWSSHGGPSGV